MKSRARIYIGDSRDILPGLIDEFGGRIALTVTSPPYFVGRGYESYIKDWQGYWEMLYDVFGAVTPLMEPFGKVAINFADKYANAAQYGRACEIPYIPSYAVMMHDVFKYDLWARIIWDKVRVMIDGARHTTAKSRFAGGMRVAPNWEYIFVWRKYIAGEKPPHKDIDMTKDEWTEWVNGIWRFSSVKNNPRIGNTKLAIFPDELPRRLIKMYTQRDDIVLDPFLGTGTTLKQAIMLGRFGIGVEKNRDTLDIILENLCPGMSDMFLDNSVEIIE